MNVFVLLEAALTEDKVHTDPTGRKGSVEDQQVINDTITKYGLPQNFQALGLPGPELEAREYTCSTPDQLVSGKSGTYTLKVRTITKSFSYNARYEDTKLKTTENQKTIITKGQYGEHFERKSGGYYIRVIGYTLDENGYRQFLISLCTAETIKEEVTPSIVGDSKPSTSTVSNSHRSFIHKRQVTYATLLKFLTFNLVMYLVRYLKSKNLFDGNL